ncbi:Uncharacterised protein [Vibrio cholerae]|nr:Uncharacterised protein [Vibrio cholerae]
MPQGLTKVASQSIGSKISALLTVILACCGRGKIANLKSATGTGKLSISPC